MARLRDGYTIEEHYQLRIKGYGTLGVDDWRIGKGKPALDPSIDLYEAYKGLWLQWVTENETLFMELRRNVCAHGMKLSDMFATGPVSQARALCDLLNQIPF